MLQYFFRVGEDGWKFPFYGPLHISIIAITLVLICIFLFARKKILPYKFRKVEIALAILLIVLESSRYIWKLIMCDFNLLDDLPLFHCRITMFLAAYALLSKNNGARSFAAYWGYFGGILAVLSPDPYKFTPHHFTNYTFFIAHIGLLITAVHLSTEKDFSFDLSGLISVCTITNAFNIIAIVANIILGSNYAFMAKPPVLTNLLYSHGQLAYTISALIFMNVINLAIFTIGRSIKSLTISK